jgi:hypothetical protein
MCTRPSRSKIPFWFHEASSFGVVALLFLLVTCTPLMGQMPVVSGLNTAPRSLAPSVSGLVSAVDGNTVGSNVSVTGYSLPNPMAGAGAVAPSAMAFIATEISTVP